MFNTWIALLSFMPDEFIIRKKKTKNWAQNSNRACKPAPAISNPNLSFPFFLSSLSIYLIASGSLPLSLSASLPLFVPSHLSELEQTFSLSFNWNKHTNTKQRRCLACNMKHSPWKENCPIPFGIYINCAYVQMSVCKYATCTGQVRGCAHMFLLLCTSNFPLCMCYMREKNRVSMRVCVGAVWVWMCLPVCPLCVGVSVGGRPAFIIPELVSNPGLLSGLYL